MVIFPGESETEAGKVGEQKPKIITRTPEDIAKILTSKRIRLLRVIREKKPESYFEYLELYLASL
ncbi:HVO_A0114 family putative DNA-binding protein [Methanosarcina sp. Mfa9]|uniref:HVO_A0114 family putative DNA-binding protein n=1 Tax=Methanosarcina sp. Mfa9 TaxID=3439063 RepID=UPI003F848FCF